MPAADRILLTDLLPRRVALIKPSALGDIVHALPVLTALRRRFPLAHITWIVNRHYEPLLHGHPDLDATLAFDRFALRGNVLQAPWTYLQFIRRLRAGRFDLVIDLQGLFRSGVMALISGAPRRVGLADAREGAAHCYTDVIPLPEGDTLHAVERCWLAAQALGVAGLPVEPRVPLSEAGIRWVVDTLGDCPRPWLLLGVGASWQTKRWPAEHFAELARRAQDGFGGTAVFVGHRVEGLPARAAARHLPGPVRDLTGRTTLPQLAALVSRADVMVANDSGPAHLAAALGRPVVAPYTCTSVRRHGPYRALGGAVEAQVWCQGSYRKRCDRLECMAELTPDRLWPVLREVLESWETDCRSA